MGGGEVAGRCVPFRRIVLALPRGLEQQAETFLDASGIPFQVVLEPTPDLPALGVRCASSIVLYASSPQQEAEWLSRLAAVGLARYALLDDFSWDPAEWVEKWKDSYQWIRVSDRLAVGPDFRTPPEGVACCVKIAPGQSFGTGMHESTLIALRLLDSYLLPGGTVLDAGCGSGVLGIAACRLSASSVLGFDIESEACRETRENARINGVVLDVFRGGAEAVVGAFDLVVANMLATQLLSLSRLLRCAVKPQATLILSGLIDSDSPAFEKEFFDGPPAFSLLERVSLRRWWGAAFVREP